MQEAARVSYVHGMTGEIAHRQVGPEGVPSLLRLLEDPTFPRPDNVVAFLAYLGGPESTPRLQAFLGRELADEAAGGRARLLVPEALGRIAARGDVSALSVLLSMVNTSDSTLREAAIMGLALSHRPEAEEALDRLTMYAETAPVVAMSRTWAITPPSPDGNVTFAPSAPFSVDPSALAHLAAITWANHVSLSFDAMTAVQADVLLRDATQIAGTSSYAEDVACCMVFASTGSGAVFGRAGDGLDVVQTAAELQAVIAAGQNRVKVVRAIQWCGGPGTNILGCSPNPGRSVVVVRDVNEALLWLHEYGHNVGLPHVQDPRSVMFPFLTGSNFGLSEVECAAHHAPPPLAAMTLQDAGACTDEDGDGVVVTTDFCPTVFDPNQVDSDGDGLGNACDICPVAWDPDQADGDGDRRGDACDNCLVLSNPGQQNADGDLLGDACDACPFDARNDEDGDGVCGDVDVCRDAADPGQENADGDFLGDACDRCPHDALDDLDHDGLCSDVDLCPEVTNPVLPWTVEGEQPGEFGLRLVGAGDVDGDGLAELLTSDPMHDRFYIDPLQHEGAVYLYAGRPGMPSTRPAWSVLGRDIDDRVGNAVAAAGDVNRDGYMDVLVTTSRDSFPGGTRLPYVDLFLGSDRGLSSVPSWRRFGAGTLERYGAILAGLGDVNGDGFDDILIAAPDRTVAGEGIVGVAEIFHGSAAGPPAAPTEVLMGRADLHLQWHMIGAGDVNGDGFDELAISEIYRVGGLYGSAVHLFSGSRAGLGSVPSWTVTGALGNSQMGASLAAGDVDGDGYGDLLVGNPDPGRVPGQSEVLVFLGSAAGLSTVPSWRFSGIGGHDYVGWGVASGGDVNGDGKDDLLVHAEGDDRRDRVYLFLGSSTGLGTRPVWAFVDPGTSTDFGEALALPGDLDGDGFGEIAIARAGFPNRGPVWVWRGGPAGPNAWQGDLDHDGAGNECDADDDGDGFDDPWDRCPSLPDPGQTDTDGDSVGDLCDLCPGVADAYQGDLDGDGQGDACDADDDGDGWPDGLDSCPTVFDPSQQDADQDGTGDACDPCVDADHDGYGRTISLQCPRAHRWEDCNDTLRGVHPGAYDICDGVDNDCSGLADDAVCNDLRLPGANMVIDGLELVWLGRGFGECGTPEDASLWWLPVDYTSDLCLDGEDLAVLGSLFGCRGAEPVCRSGAQGGLRP